jgi:predicted transcriptional regulator
VIKQNKHKYSIPALCKILKITRSTFYYESQLGEATDETPQAIVDIFKENKSNYGTRKIKEELRKLDFTV